jgi:hypothetical protein
LVLVARERSDLAVVARSPERSDLAIELVDWPEHSDSAPTAGAVVPRTERDGQTPSLRRAAEPEATPLRPGGTDPASGVPPDPPFPIEPVSPAPITETEPPRISLAQAGYTEPSLWALPDTPLESKTERSERRLEKNLAESAMRRDYQRSVGIEGPVVVALNQNAYGLAPPRSKAVVSVVVESNGRVSAVEVLEVNEGMDRWRQVTSKVLSTLRTKTLRVPPGQRVEMVFEVESKVLMPSGRLPQRGVSVLGVPLGGNDDTHEPMVKLLHPEFGVDKVPMPKPGNPDEDIEVPTLRMGMSVLSVNADPSDWAAHARQVVHSKLIRQRLL